MERVEPGTEIKKHTEGIALFSTRNECYGMSITDLVEEIKPRLTGYGDSINVETHNDCLEMAVDCGPDTNKQLIEQSVWLIECSCAIREEYRLHLKYLLQGTFPRAGNSLIWVDDDIHDLSSEQKADIESFCTKTKVVYSKEKLSSMLESYLEYNANPAFGSGSIVEWMNAVHHFQKNI